MTRWEIRERNGDASRFYLLCLSKVVEALECGRMVNKRRMVALEFECGRVVNMWRMEGCLRGCRILCLIRKRRKGSGLLLLSYGKSDVRSWWSSSVTPRLTP